MWKYVNVEMFYVRPAFKWVKNFRQSSSYR
jgi:hypothetical protein